MEKQRNLEQRKRKQQKEKEILEKNNKNARRRNLKPIKVLNKKGEVIKLLDPITCKEIK